MYDVSRGNICYGCAPCHAHWRTSAISLNQPYSGSVGGVKYLVTHAYGARVSNRDGIKTSGAVYSQQGKVTMCEFCLDPPG